MCGVNAEGNAEGMKKDAEWNEVKEAVNEKNACKRMFKK